MMKVRSLVLWSLFTVAPAGLAQDDGRGQSIMFEDSAVDRYEDVTRAPPKPSLGERCLEMARELEALKGKPQRRSALMARYREECPMR
jgi:hypothetical protein